MRPEDLDHAREAIRQGSLSFYAASKLLPARVRDPALVLYAFCRIADDAVDLGDDKAAAVLSLGERLDLIYRGTPRDRPVDRAFASVVEQFEMPRALPEALLEGLAWDATERQYASRSALFQYCARVAAAVGAMMCVLMRVRDRHVLARACDLGVAMQLTNIARDVGEDARAGRLYLPLDWLEEAGVDRAAFLADPQATPAIKDLTKRLLSQATRLYYRSEPGIPALPLDCRPGIYAARHIYAAIGASVERNGWDSIQYRARTNSRQKLGLLGLSVLRTLNASVMPGSSVLYAPALEETQFLVDAAARTSTERQGRAEQLLAVLAQLEARDRAIGAPGRFRA